MQAILHDLKQKNFPRPLTQHKLKTKLVNSRQLGRKGLTRLNYVIHKQFV